MSAITHHQSQSRDPRRGRDADLATPPDPAADIRPLERALLTPEQAARVLGIGRSKVYELIIAGTLASVKIGACRRVPIDAVEAFVAELRSEQR